MFSVGSVGAVSFTFTVAEPLAGTVTVAGADIVADASWKNVLPSPIALPSVAMPSDLAIVYVTGALDEFVSVSFVVFGPSEPSPSEILPGDTVCFVVIGRGDLDQAAALAMDGLEVAGSRIPRTSPRSWPWSAAARVPSSSCP